MMSTSGLPLRVGVLGAPGYGRRGLEAALRDAGALVLTEAEADVLVMEGVPDGAAAESPAPPVVCLVESVAQGEEALQRGARAALMQDAEPLTLLRALEAVQVGLCVVDARLRPLVVRDRGAAAPAASVSAPELTPREQQVLELLASGLTNREIAAELSVSSHTAKFHVEAILEKMGAQTRTEAVVLAARLGVLKL